MRPRVERKTYRESLQNNREAVLTSKELVTIKTDVAVEFEPEAMRAQEPDAAAARALFTELEFTTLVQDFLQESVELGETDYRDAQSAAEVEAVVALAAKPGGVLAIALESTAQPTTVADEEGEEEQDSEQLSLSAAPQVFAAPATLRVAISAEPGKALTLTLDDSDDSAAPEARPCG